MVRIMIVEDESIVALNMQHTLVRLGYEVVGVAGTSAEAISLAQAERPDLILMDINLGRGGDGIETAAQLSGDRHTPVIYLTAYSEEATLKRARETKPYGYLLKPFSERELHATIQMALERCRFDATLADGEERLRLALDAAQMVSWEFDTESGRLQCWGLAGHLLGTDTQTFDGSWTALLDHVAPDDRDAVRAAHAKAVGNGGLMSVEFRALRADGTKPWMLVQARSHGQPGAPRRLIGVAQDITARHEAELGLLEVSSLLRTVLDSASEIAIIATDPSLTIKVLNAGAERLLGYKSDEMVGRTMPILIHDMDQVRARGEELAAQLGHPVESDTVLVEPSTLQQPHEWTYLRKDGGRVPVSLVVTAMHTDEGELLGYLSVARDVTRELQHEESLHEATRTAEQASLAKSQFLANMSHEIRTPMNAVIGLSYLLERTELNAEQAAFLAKIIFSSKALLSVINDVLDLSKIEAGELIVECAAFNPRSLLRELADVMAVQADAKGIAFEIDLADDLPAALEGDSTRLNQILTNLLSNAIKFTERGGVGLRVQRIADTPKGVTLRFDVRDSGIGIATDVQARLFAPFAQADASTTRRFGGTGLGLSIVKRLADLMGGEVRLQSAPGAGSEFRVELNFALASPDALALLEASPTATLQHALTGVHLLVVDDSDINLDVTRRILELEGAQVELASNGQEAVERLQDKPHDFDVVLMDVQMPVLDGYAATRRIRMELQLTDLPIIALTAGALTSERESSAAAGMDDFISKPFSPPALVRSILRHVKPACRPPRSTDVAPEALTQAALPWPDIAGIDSTDVRARLSDDLGLFRSSLKRLLDEFSDVVIPATARDPVALAIHGARMHKLRGSAGLLGAKAIQQIAGEAEAACVTGDVEQASRLAARLAAQLQALRESAAPVLQAVRPAVEEAELTGGGEPDSQVLADLVGLLRRQSLSATKHFGASSAQLRRLLGKGSYELVREHIDNLQFEDAANALEAHQR